MITVEPTEKDETVQFLSTTPASENEIENAIIIQKSADPIEPRRDSTSDNEMERTNTNNEITPIVFLEPVVKSVRPVWI